MRLRLNTEKTTARALDEGQSRDRSTRLPLRWAVILFSAGLVALLLGARHADLATTITCAVAVALALDAILE
jgi:hypothetical protein